MTNIHKYENNYDTDFENDEFYFYNKKNDMRRFNKILNTKNHFDKIKYNKKETKYESLNINKDKDKENRDKNILIVRETIDILRKGYYEKDDELINIEYLLNECCILTKLYTAASNKTIIHNVKTKFDVYFGSLIEITEKYSKKFNNKHVCIFNFSDPYKLCKDFLNGQENEEISLLHKSGLYKCFTNLKYDNESMKKILGNDNAIFSQCVPFFRNYDQKIIKYPYYVSVITTIFPNIDDLKNKNNEEELIYKLIYKKIHMILSIAHEQGVNTLIFGNFGNNILEYDNQMICKILYILLTTEFKNVFDNILFTVVNNTKYDILYKFFENKI